MKQFVPRVAAVHDLSCIGRCSLTVIMPVLAAMGVQVCPLPTAVLSTHLGGFREVAFCDFTDRMAAVYHHWQREDIAFDCIYSGFLASAEQIDVVLSFINEFSGNRPLVLVDPVMGDEGKLYSVYTATMQEQMKKLVKKADIITPNYTEACFLLGETYQPGSCDRSQLQDWLARLADLGPRQVIITGIPAKDGTILNMAYDKTSGHHWQVFSQHIPARYPGTGDIFASVLAGALLSGASLQDAMHKAAQFVTWCVEITYKAGAPAREGVLLEKVLPQLWNGSGSAH